MKLNTIVLLLLIGTTAAYNCSIAAIKVFLPPNSKVFYTKHVEANANFTPPIVDNFGLVGASAGQPIIIPRAGCIVQGNVSLPGNTYYSFGLMLPDDWNQRFLVAGNGGFAGSISWSSIADAMWYGFAAISTDTGHEALSTNAVWAYKNPAALQNTGYRAMHDTVLRGKAVIKGYYGGAIIFSYFRGCSAGGKQGLKEAEMFPDDFDGVIAGAPAWWTTHLQLWIGIVAYWNLPVTAPYHIPAALFDVIADEVIRQCDSQDGVVDNILQDPLGCQFRPELLLCAENIQNKSACLTPDQLNTVNKLHRDWVEANSTFIFPNFTLGSEWGWAGLVSSVSGLGSNYVKWMLGLGSQWTYEADWNPDIIALSDRLNPGNATTDHFDLSPFYQKGGRIIHYHGYSDAGIPTGSSIYFYNKVAEAMTPKGIDLNDFYRLFLIPGMGHCTGTSPSMNAPWYIAGDFQPGQLGPNVHGVPEFQDSQHDVLLAMMAWVENGTAPQQMIATKYVHDTTHDQVLRQRPVCVYPARAVYRGWGWSWNWGAGNADVADNWACEPL